LYSSWEELEVLLSNNERVDCDNQFSIGLFSLHLCLSDSETVSNISFTNLELFNKIGIIDLLSVVSIFSGKSKIKNSECILSGITSCLVSIVSVLFNCSSLRNE